MQHLNLMTKDFKKYYKYIMKNTLKKKLRKKNSRNKKGGQVPSSSPGSLTGTDRSIGPVTGTNLQQNTSDDIDDIIYKTNKREMTFINRFIRFIKKIIERIKNFGRYNGGKRKTVKRKNKKRKTLRYKKK